MLTWLRDQVIGLWSFISSIPGRISNAVQQAVGLAWVLYARAVAAAQALFAGVSALAWVLYARAAAAAQALVAGVSALAWVLYARAVAAAQALVGGAVALALTLYERAVGAAQALVGGAVALARALAEAAADRVRQMLDPRLAALEAAWSRIVAQLTLLFADPAAWIMAFLAPFLLAWLMEEVAYGLGATRAPLPPRQSLFGGGGEVAYPPTAAPPAAAAGLSRPLRSIYVSGNRFAPSHNGVDLGLVTGEPVFAMHAGAVRFAGADQRGFGLMVEIAGGDWRTRYAHLLDVGVAVGERVEAGQQIARGDSTGNSTGPHLHLAVWYRGAAIDPLSVLP